MVKQLNSSDELELSPRPAPPPLSSSAANALIESMRCRNDAIFGYASWMIAWCALTPEQRKEAREDARKRVKPPTEKQLAFLHSLKFEGVAPVTRFEASTIIHDLLRAYPPTERQRHALLARGFSQEDLTTISRAEAHRLLNFEGVLEAARR